MIRILDSMDNHDQSCRHFNVQSGGEVIDGLHFYLPSSARGQYSVFVSIPWPLWSRQSKMDTRSWQSSANRYYAFDDEQREMLRRISKTPPPRSNRSPRSPLPTTCTRKSTPTSPMRETSTLPGSRLLDRISPKRCSPRSKPTRELPPLSPELGDYLDPHLGKEEEEGEQVMRVLDNNHELVFQRDFGMDELQDRDGDPHESRNSSPVKKRKLGHPDQSIPQTSPTQNKRPRSRSRSPPIPQATASHSTKQPRLGVDWSSGSSMKGGTQFGKLSGLTFDFARRSYVASAKVNTNGEATAYFSESSRNDRQVDKDNSRRLEDTHESTLPSTTMITGDNSKKARKRSTREGGEISISNGGASLLHRIGSHGPISDPELEVPLEGGEDHDLGHEVNHEGGYMIECDASLVIAPSLIPSSLSRDILMDSPPPHNESPRTLIHEGLPEDVAQSPSVTSPRKFTSPPQAEGADEEIKTMEQHAEEFLQDIQKEFLSRTEAQATSPFAPLEGIIPVLPGGTSASPHDHNEHPCISPTPILDGISPLVADRSISPIFGIGGRYPNSGVVSASTGSALEKHPSSIARFSSDLDSNDTLLEIDPELDQITKQALGDLIVHNLKLNHNLDANDAVRRAIRLEVDEHARDFLRLATKLARRMDLMGTPLNSTVKVPDMEPNQLLVEPILSDSAENGYPEYLSPIEGSEDNEEPQPPKEDTQRVASNVEMDSVPPEVSRSDSEDKVKFEPSDNPAGEQEPDFEPTDKHAERVDHLKSADEDDSPESGLDIPGVWCARTGKDRTDTLQEHVEVSKVLAARVKKWVKKNSGS